MTVEELFKQGNGTLTLEQFTEIADLVKQYRAFSKKCKLPLYWENTII